MNDYMCRTCLAPKVDRNIGDLCLVQDKQTKSSTDILSFCVDIRVHLESEISTKLCESCYQKIVDIYKFKSLVIKNNDYLNSLVYKANSPEINNSTEFNNICSENECSYNDQDDKLPVKLEEEIKEEYLTDNKSEDEFLSAILENKIKYELEEDSKDVTSNRIKPERSRHKTKKKVKQKDHVCEDCGKVVLNLKIHIKKYHSQPKTREIYKCEACSMTFSNNTMRRKHKKSKHRVKQTCTICNKDVVHLKSHMLSIHNPNELPYPCSECHRRFISKTKLSDHIVTHTKERPYQCDVCDKSFTTKVLLQMHKRRVHEKERTHMCQYCSKTFFQLYHLQVHLRGHLKEKPYKCNICGKCYVSSTVLKNHKETHNDVKSYPCPQCDMTFSSRRYVKSHMVGHTKEKRFPCSYCGVRFHRSDHRLRHQRTAHESVNLRNANTKAPL